MKTFLFATISIILLMSFTNKSEKTKSANSMKTDLYSIQLTSIEGKAIDLNQFKGKKILFVNVASKCGFTSQYKQLQELHEKYNEKLQIIGIPCNQFGSQEPGSENEIQEFCSKNFGVSFLMTEKYNVKGNNQHPLYKWLTNKNENNVKDSSVQWNFQKYLIDENGKLLEVFKSSVNPLDEVLTNLL